MSNYDAWLERPYQQAASEQEHYEQWCDDNELDPGEDHWSDYEKWVEDAKADAQIAAHEARMEEIEWERNNNW